MALLWSASHAKTNTTMAGLIVVGMVSCIPSTTATALPANLEMINGVQAPAIVSRSKARDAGALLAHKQAKPLVNEDKLWMITLFVHGSTTLHTVVQN
jgi:hypothetical protein